MATVFHGVVLHPNNELNCDHYECATPSRKILNRVAVISYYGAFFGTVIYAATYKRRNLLPMSQYRFRTLTQFCMVVTLNCFLLQSLVGVYGAKHTRGSLPNSERISAAFNNDDGILNDITYLLDLFMTPVVLLFLLIQLMAPKLILQTAVSTVKYERQLVGESHYAYSQDAPQMDEKKEKELKSTREFLDCLKIFGIAGSDEVTAAIHEELEATDSSEIPVANNCYQQFSQKPLITFVVFVRWANSSLWFLLSCACQSHHISQQR
jgi:hypothetical protein